MPEVIYLNSDHKHKDTYKHVNISNPRDRPYQTNEFESGH